MASDLARELRRIIDLEGVCATAADRIEALEAEVERLREALQAIAAYGRDGICPYGCDTPYIARAALAGEGDKNG